MNYLILIYYGFISLMSQLLIFRVLAVIFYGNELFLGVALSSWLFWVGLGSLLAKRILGLFRNPTITLADTLVFIAFVLPLELLLIRMSKALFPFGAFIGPLTMILFTFTALSIFCFSLGAIFPIACRFIQVADVYLCETIGAIIAGLLFTFFLVGRVPIAAISLILSAGAVILSGYLFNKEKAKVKTVAAAILFFIFISVFPQLKSLSEKAEWKGYNLLAHTESRYADIAVTRLGSLMNLFEDGKISAHFPDEVFYEEAVHLPMLLHNHPKDILVGSAAMWGQLSETLKYDVDRVDYVELDAKKINTLRPFLNPKDKSSLDDERIKIHNIDIRLWLKDKTSVYDVIILNLGEPSNLKINRFYTKEFYRQLRQVLKPDGVLAFSVPSAENYLAGYIQLFNASVYETLKKEFGYIEFVPGDNLLFLASNSKIDLDQETLKVRLEERKISNTYVVPTYFKNRLSHERRDYVKISLASVKQPRINSDLEPITYYYFGKMWLAKFYSPLYFIFAMAVLLLLACVVRNIPKIYRLILQNNKLIPIFTIGFMGIIVEIILLFVFQSACGFVYWQLGLLFASFMFGVSLGSLMARKINKLSISALQAVMIITILVLAIFLPRAYTLPIGLILIVFPITLILIGSFIGAVFVATTRIEEKAEKVYTADVLGASSGPLLAGSLFIPLFGLSGTLFITIAVGIIGLFLFKIKKIEY